MDTAGTFAIIVHSSDADAARMLRTHIVLMRRNGWKEVALTDNPMMVLIIMSAALLSDCEDQVVAAFQMRRDGVRVIPIRYRPFDGHMDMILQTTPRDRPIIEYSCQDTAWAEVAREIRDAAKSVLVVRQSSQVDRRHSAVAAISSGPTMMLPPRRVG